MGTNATMSEAAADSAPYVGEPLVSDESFLRKLPVALHVKERLRYDAFVIAADIIAQAFSLLRQFTAQAGNEMENFTNGFRAHALSLCWTMVDQLHAIRQLLQPPGGTKSGPFTQAFLDAAESATSLRNRMDHLADNLDNLSKTKGSKPPLFGSLSYFHAADPGAAEKRGNIITIMSGSLHGKHTMPCVNPAGRAFTLPTGLFTLSAFGLDLDFGSAIGALRDLIQRMESTMEDDLRGQLDQLAVSPEDAEEAMKSHGGGLTLIMTIEFATEAGGDSS